MITVSVILPNYNHAPFLEQRIESILFQTYTDYELIILDDASTDNSLDIIEKYSTHPKISRTLYNQTNSGSPFRQWKKGIELAKGDWVWIAESDDIADIHFLDKLMNLVSTCPGISFGYCDAYIKDEMKVESSMKSFANIKDRKFRTVKWKNSYLVPGERDLNESLKWECTVNNVSSVLFNKKDLREAINHLQTYRYHGDWLLYILLAQTGMIAYTPDILNTYRNHEKNHSKAENYIFQSKKECFAILDYMLQQKTITQKKELIDYFTKTYVGFGLIKEKGLAKNGLFNEYRKINKALAFKILSRLLLNMLKVN